MSTITVSSFEMITIFLAGSVSIYAGIVYLRESQRHTWFNQPNLLLGISLLMFSLLSLLGVGFAINMLDKTLCLTLMMVFFLGMAFFLGRSLLLIFTKFA